MHFKAEFPSADRGPMTAMRNKKKLTVKTKIARNAKKLRKIECLPENVKNLTKN
jgi:hypothetical protein